MFKTLAGKSSITQKFYGMVYQGDTLVWQSKNDYETAAGALQIAECAKIRLEAVANKKKGA